jgi:hypothetical protein
MNFKEIYLYGKYSLKTTQEKKLKMKIKTKYKIINVYKWIIFTNSALKEVQ